MDKEKAIIKYKSLILRGRDMLFNKDGLIKGTKDMKFNL
jgi:hypothetical protein